MKRQVRHNGFSLTEALIATGILAMGLVMIAMAFPVGVKLASIATERPVGVVTANEALCKMRLYGIRPFSDNLAWGWPSRDPNLTCTDYWQVCRTTFSAVAQDNQREQDDQRCYPSLVPQPQERRYYWSALVRRADKNTDEIQATVFVCRMLGMGSTYYFMDHTLVPIRANSGNSWPVPVKVQVQISTVAPLSVKEIQILPYDTGNPIEYQFFTEGCFIVEDSTGTIYRVVEMKDKDSDAAGIKETLVLDKNFTTGTSVWVVPPAIGSHRNPCIDIVQKTLTIK
jgi:Tfp pilus assembly protein PilV